MHEQSETIERDGKFFNVYGSGTPKAGQDLPGEKPYDTLDAAVTAAKARSHSFDDPFSDIPAASGSDPFSDLPPAEKSTAEKSLKGSATAGAIEAAMSVGSNIAGAVAGTGYAAATGDPGVIEPIQESMTYEPRTQRGKDITKVINAPFQKLDEFAEWLGEKNREASGSPGFSAGVKTVIDALPMLLGRPRSAAREAPAEKPAAAPVAQPAPSAPPPAREFPVAAETPAVRPEGAIRRTKPAPGAEVAPEDPFADLPNAGNLEDVPAFQPKTAPAEAAPRLPHEDFVPSGTPEGLEKLKAQLNAKNAELGEFALLESTPEQLRKDAALVEQAKALAAEEDEFEEATKGETVKLEDEEALRRFGPGTLGMNAALNPEVIKQAARDMKAGAKAVVEEAFGTPGAYRNLYGPVRDLEQHNVARIDRWAAGESHAIKRAFPDQAGRENLTERIVRGDMGGLAGIQLEVAERLRRNYAAMGEYALRAEQLDGLRQNYSPQIWDINDPRTRQLIQMFRDARDAGPIREGSPLLRDPSGSGMFSPFKLQRAISDVFEGMQMGMKPASLDAAELFTTYARSMGRAVERSKAMTSLHQLLSDDGTPMVMPMKQAPRGYVPIRYPELEGYAVHPDIAAAVRVVLESDTPGAVGIALQSIAYASKRGLVSYSLFHPSSLFLAWKGTLPAGRLLDFNAKGAIDAALKKYREGGPGDAVDKLLAGGLKIGAPIDDLMGRERFGRVAAKVERVADRLNLGGGVRVPRAIDRKLQQATWDYVQTGFKLDVATRFFEDALVKNADKIARGEITEAEIARQAAETANGIQGGLNWERMIDKFDTPAGRRIMSDILSKNGRRWMQTFAFAPDWLVSTVSTWTNAATGGERAQVRRALSRRYLITSAVITYTYGNLLNYYFTGHSMFENRSNKKDATWLDDMKAKTEIQLGGGLRINPNKHFLEVPHMLADPLQFALNKANPATVGEPLEQLFNKEWLSTGYAPPITKTGDSKLTRIGKRAKHAALKFAPITGRSVMEQGPAGIGGFLGFPVSGVSEEQKERERTERVIAHAGRP